MSTTTMVRPAVMAGELSYRVQVQGDYFFRYDCTLMIAIDSSRAVSPVRRRGSGVSTTPAQPIG